MLRLLTILLLAGLPMGLIWLQPDLGTSLVFGAILLGMLLGARLEAQSQSGVRQETIRIPGPIKGLKLALRHVVSSSATPGAGSRRVVLILHGAAVPVSGSGETMNFFVRIGQRF